MIKVISFDLDDTLVDTGFDALIWFEEIPKLYAEKNSVDLETAKKEVCAEYDKMKDHPNWTVISFWFKHFGLTGWEKMVDDLRGEVSLFPDVIPVLERLKKDFILIVVTASDRTFFDVKLKVDGLGKYFDKVYSTVEHFNQRHKDAGVFQRVIDDYDISKDEIVHIGDNENNDYNAPRDTGINAFLLDRRRSEIGEHIVGDLYEFCKKIGVRVEK